MNRRVGFIGAAVVAGALALGTIGSASAQQSQPGPGHGAGGMMGGSGPRTGQTQPGPGPGPGMMGGSGMMGGYGPGGMMGGGSWQGQGQQAQPLNSLDDAKGAFQRYVAETGNQNLALDEVIQFQNGFYAIVKDTATGNGAFELLADPQTGAVFPEMGPGMMWNTQFGPMAGSGARGMMGMMGGLWSQPQVQPTVDAAKAQQIAQQWLDGNQPGSGAEAPDAFPGYFTVHFAKDGQIAGLLSVNAYTGPVWSHTWHGAFVASTEA